MNDGKFKTKMDLQSFGFTSSKEEEPPLRNQDLMKRKGIKFMMKKREIVHLYRPLTIKGTKHVKGHIINPMLSQPQKRVELEPEDK